MANSWKLAGSLTTYSSANVREATSRSPLESEATYDEQVVQQGRLPAGSGYYEVSLGAIDTSVLMELRIDIPRTVRLNGNAVFEDCQRLLIHGEVTSLEIDMHVSQTPLFWAQFFA